jgi:hypothetical protein
LSKITIVAFVNWCDSRLPSIMAVSSQGAGFMIATCTPPAGRLDNALPSALAISRFLERAFAALVGMLLCG